MKILILNEIKKLKNVKMTIFTLSSHLYDFFPHFKIYTYTIVTRRWKQEKYHKQIHLCNIKILDYHILLSTLYIHIYFYCRILKKK